MTGRFSLCPGSHYLHPGAVYVQIQVKNRFFVRCGCGSTSYMGPAWTDGMGLTYEQALVEAQRVGGAVV